MELEDFKCELLALQKLYGLLLGTEAFLQDSDVDERARLMLKNLLDGATEKVFETHLKMTDTEQSGFSNLSDPSKADQFNAGQQYLAPVSGNSSKSYPKVLPNSSKNTSFYPLDSHPTLQKLSPDLSRLGSISSNKLDNKKKLCQCCNRSSMKLRNRNVVLGRDVDSSEQPRDKLCSIDRISRQSKTLKGIELYKNNQWQIYDESENDFAREVVVAIKRIESSISALQLSSANPDDLKTSIAHTSNPVPKERVLAGSRQIQVHQRLDKGPDDSVSQFMSRKEELLINSCQSLSKRGYNSKASKSAMQEYVTPRQGPGRNVKAIVDNLESLSGPANQTSQSHQYVQGLRLPPSQNSSVKRTFFSVGMPNQNFEDDAVRKRMADADSTTQPVKSRLSMPRMPEGSTVPMRNKLPHQVDPVHKWKAGTHTKTKSVKSTLSLPPKSARSIVSMTPNQRSKLQHQAILGPTLLDHETSIPSHNVTTDRRSFPPTQELEESSSSDLSSSSQPHSSWTSQRTSTGNRSSEAESESQTWSSHRFDPASRLSSNVTSGSSSEDSAPSNLGPMNKMGPVVRRRSADHANPRKATGRLRRFKNKLGLIFHHHHHHHHHVEGDDRDHTTSMWNKFQGIFHHENHPKVYEKQAVVKVRNAAAKEQVGHFHALVDGLLRHTRHKKKSMHSKGGIKRLGTTTMAKKLHWWQKKMKHGKGVKLPNRGRPKIRMTNKTSKQKLLTHK